MKKKKRFGDVIEDDVIELSAKYDEIDMDDVREIYRLVNIGIESRWYFYKEATMRQLQQVHQLILDADAEFIGECLDADSRRKRAERHRTTHLRKPLIVVKRRL